MARYESVSNIWICPLCDERIESGEIELLIDNQWSLEVGREAVSALAKQLLDRAVAQHRLIDHDPADAETLASRVCQERDAVVQAHAAEVQCKAGQEVAG